MPTYSYACTECDHRFDAVQAFTEDALTSCPQCSGRLRKLFNSVGVVFKGSGFYRNDSRESTGKSSTSGSDKPSEKSSEKSSKPEKSSGGDTSSSSASSASSGSTPSSSTSSAPAAASS